MGAPGLRMKLALPRNLKGLRRSSVEGRGLVGDQRKGGMRWGEEGEGWMKRAEGGLETETVLQKAASLANFCWGAELVAAEGPLGSKDEELLVLKANFSGTLADFVFPPRVGLRRSFFEGRGKTAAKPLL